MSPIAAAITTSSRESTDAENTSDGAISMISGTMESPQVDHHHHHQHHHRDRDVITHDECSHINSVDQDRDDETEVDLYMEFMRAWQGQPGSGRRRYRHSWSSESSSSSSSSSVSLYAPWSLNGDSEDINDILGITRFRRRERRRCTPTATVRRRKKEVRKTINIGPIPIERTTEHPENDIQSVSSSSSSSSVRTRVRGFIAFRLSPRSKAHVSPRRDDGTMVPPKRSPRERLLKLKRTVSDGFLRKTKKRGTAENEEPPVDIWSTQVIHTLRSPRKADAASSAESESY